MRHAGSVRRVAEELNFTRAGRAAPPLAPALSRQIAHLRAARQRAAAPPAPPPRRRADSHGRGACSNVCADCWTASTRRSARPSRSTAARRSRGAVVGPNRRPLRRPGRRRATRAAWDRSARSFGPAQRDHDDAGDRHRRRLGLRTHGDVGDPPARDAVRAQQRARARLHVSASRRWRVRSPRRPAARSAGARTLRLAPRSVPCPPTSTFPGAAAFRVAAGPGPFPRDHDRRRVLQHSSRARSCSPVATPGSRSPAAWCCCARAPRPHLAVPLPPRRTSSARRSTCASGSTSTSTATPSTARCSTPRSPTCTACRRCCSRPPPATA